MSSESSSKQALETSTHNPIPQEPCSSEPEISQKPGTNAFTSKYQIIREIGHGTQGRVYQSQRRADGQIVVAKQLNIHSIKTWKEYELFHREAEVLGNLRIPGVAQFYEAIECLEDDPPCSYIIQEFIEGVSLQQMLQKGYRFMVTEVYDILIQTLTILDKLQHNDPPIIHRDIKPSNLMISTDHDGKFRVTIIDFGAVANPQIQGGGSTVAGTIGYMPPEQLTGKPVPASDIYAVGALAVQLFCGKSPADLPVKDFRMIFEPEMQDKPHALVTTLRQMLEPNVENRLTDISLIIKQFKDYQSGEYHTLPTQLNSHSYSPEFEQKLAKVSSIGEAGNVELWQRLPDDEQRTVPNVFKQLYQQKKKQKRSKSFQKIKTGAINKLGCLMSLITFVGIIAITFGATFFILEKASFLSLSANALEGLGTFLGIGISIIAAVVGILAANKLYNWTQQAKPNLLFENTKGIEKAIELIGNSRKSFATITDISYIALPLEAIYAILSPKYKDVLYTVNAIPRFKIQYKFNPPDDRRTEDIYHEYITHIEPENHYCVGDQIPILYHIHDLDLYDLVTSMPFPVPLNDFDEGEQMAPVFHSTSLVKRA